MQPGALYDGAAVAAGYLQIAGKGPDRQHQHVWPERLNSLGADLTAELALVFLIVYIPQLATFLPEMMMGK